MIRLNNVSIMLGKRRVLNNVNLELGTGIYGLLGPNGAGKTTLIRCLTGILHPSCGQITRPEHFGYLPQRFGIFKELTCYEALAFFATLKGIPRKEQSQMIKKCLDRVHLIDRKNDKIGTLSGGMLRRIGIAQALLGNPDLIIVDEPTAGLDPEERIRFKKLICELRGECTILISTHIVEDVEAVCDNIIILNEGHVVVQQSADALREYANGKVFIVPSHMKDQLVEPYYILREEYINQTLFIRVLSDQTQPGDKCQATVEDGYILYTRNST